MFIGHFAIGFAAKKFAPRAPLPLLLSAPLLADMLWPFLLLLGWEHVRIAPGDTRFTPLNLYDYPWSHSLLMLCVWAIAFAAVYYAFARYRAGAIAVWLGVVSHWVLDWITHRPDMPLFPGGGPKLGLGLWDSVAGTMVVETAMFAGALWLYVSATRARDRIGTYAFIAYVLLLAVLYIGDRFSPPPTSPAAIAWTAIVAEIVLLLWAGWFDRHRSAELQYTSESRAALHG